MIPLVVNQESETRVKARCKKKFGPGAILASILSPNDIFAELDKLV